MAACILNKNFFVIGLGGVTCGGKTTIAKRLCKEFFSNSSSICGMNVTLISQDDFYLTENLLPYLPEFEYCNWDVPEGIDFDKIIDKLKDGGDKVSDSGLNTKRLFIIEGNMVFCNKKLHPVFDKRFFFTASYEKCKAIRATRIYEPPEPPGYFDKIVWPAYLEHERMTKLSAHDYIFVDSTDYDATYRKLRIEVRKLLSVDWISLTFDRLFVDDAVEFVTGPSVGAIATFIGATRDNFEDKTVISLEYECYEEMAYKEMHKVCTDVRQLWPQVYRIAIFHRLGNVPVTESSVVIAVSTPHRKESFKASEYAIDALKKNVPIWKKEIYKDGTASWKENKM